MIPLKLLTNDELVLILQRALANDELLKNSNVSVERRCEL